LREEERERQELEELKMKKKWRSKLPPPVPRCLKYLPTGNERIMSMVDICPEIEDDIRFDKYKGVYSEFN
jgi:hypothetical protein